MQTAIIMADLELSNPAFEITVSLGGEERTVHVQPAETSDGVEYYKCNSGSTEITQIRKEEEGEWEQLWGDLEQKEVEAIGMAIEQKSA